MYTEPKTAPSPSKEKKNMLSAIQKTNLAISDQFKTSISKIILPSTSPVRAVSDIFVPGSKPRPFLRSPSKVPQ
jgi:hypothetical protein